MARWPLFAGFTGLILSFLIVLAHVSRRAMGLGGAEMQSETTDTTERGPSSGAITADETTPDEGVAPTGEERAPTDGYLAATDERAASPLDPERRVGRTRPSAERFRPVATQFEPDSGQIPFEDERIDRSSQNDRITEGDERTGVSRGADTSAGVDRLDSMSTAELLVNVAFSQGLLGVLLVAGAWYAGIPLSAFGIAVGDPWSLGLQALVGGVVLGGVLFGGNELLGRLVDDAGIEYSEGLREMLAPHSTVGWVILLGAVLPVIAGFEELLFRGTLVGAMSVGFAISPWALALFSSVVFAVGHGAQGPGGVLVTGLLGFALAAAFVVTGSLLVVVVAHYLVNALEFVVHEGVADG